MNISMNISMNSMIEFGKDLVKESSKEEGGNRDFVIKTHTVKALYLIAHHLEKLKESK